MTNVPTEIREALADAYKLFDISYPMTGSDDDWKQYWAKASELIIKYGDDIPLLALLEGYAAVIEKAIEKRQNKNRSFVWKAGEDYPYGPEDVTE